ncbi:MAG: prepilin-type N-terminal cleavage/methylation domain-containing protein [bacterium]
MKKYTFDNKKRGLSLVEVVVGAFIFALIAVSVYSGYSRLLMGATLLRAKTAAIDLANEEFEIIRNMSYSEVGIPGGIPNGLVPHIQTLTRGGTNFVLTTTIRNYDDPYDSLAGGTPKDLSPADSKVVEVSIACPTCKDFTPLEMTTKVAPKSLESASNNGTLFVKVFDASGNPLQGANVHVENNTKTPKILIDDTTDNDGMLEIIDAPPGNAVYEITATNDGYSTDKTYKPGVIGNTNPVKPHATVVKQQVTQMSLSIDKVSTLNITSTRSDCVPEAGVNFNLKGVKLIGISPSVIKYNQNFVTDDDGSITIPNVEWDTFALTLTGTTLDIVGVTPFSPVQINPGSIQNISMVVDTVSPRRLLVTVKDSAGLPVTDADVTLKRLTYSSEKITGRGYSAQSSWVGGAGQEIFSDITKYSSSDGNVDVTTVPGQIQLRKTLGLYALNGSLISSTFDAGVSSNFHEIFWNPVTNPPASGTSSVLFQIATSDSTSTPWVFTGPDGTTTSFYTLTNKTINSSNNGKRYFRYKTYLNTDSATNTPIVSDVYVTFNTSCTPAGQVSFPNLVSGTYTLTITKPGYTTFSQSVGVSANWKEQIVILNSI